VSVRILGFWDVPVETVNWTVDVVSVVLISLSTVLSAWCGYQSARWGGAQMRHYSQALADRVQASEASGQADAIRNLQVSVFMQYLAAYAANQHDLAEFLYQRFPPTMRPSVDAWVATKPLKNPHAPSSPFVMPQYHLEPLAELERANAASAIEFKAGQAANQQADNYVLFTVFFASITFIGGISTKLRRPMPMVMLTVGVTFLLILGALLLRSPIE